jgi:hypothetical protein
MMHRPARCWTSSFVTDFQHPAMISQACSPGPHTLRRSTTMPRRSQRWRVARSRHRCLRGSRDDGVVSWTYDLSVKHRCVRGVVHLCRPFVSRTFSQIGRVVIRRGLLGYCFKLCFRVCVNGSMGFSSTTQCNQLFKSASSGGNRCRACDWVTPPIVRW